MSDFNQVENLSEEQTIELYDEIIECNDNISYTCYFYNVKCKSGARFVNKSVDTGSMSERCGYFSNYYKDPCYTCYQLGCGGGYQAGADLTGYCQC